MDGDTQRDGGRLDGVMPMFQQLARGEIGENNFAVISYRNDGMTVIAQQSETVVNGRKRHMFSKGAFEMTPETLFVMRDLIDRALLALFENYDLTPETLDKMQVLLEQQRQRQSA